MSVLLGVGHLSLQTAPHIFTQDIVFNAEGDVAFDVWLHNLKKIT